MIKVSIERENGEVITMNGSATVSILIRPEDSTAVSSVTMAGVTNPFDIMCAIADTAASLLEEICKDDVEKAQLAGVMLQRFEQDVCMGFEQKGQYFKKGRVEITPVEKEE